VQTGRGGTGEACRRTVQRRRHARRPPEVAVAPVGWGGAWRREGARGEGSSAVPVPVPVPVGCCPRPEGSAPLSGVRSPSPRLARGPTRPDRCCVCVVSD
jgi:hypothetical protein